MTKARALASTREELAHEIITDALGHGRAMDRVIGQGKVDDKE